MRHRFKYRELSRSIKRRKRLLRNLVDALVTHERIHTTLARALELRRLAEKVVYIAKQGKDSDKYHLKGIMRTIYAVNQIYQVLVPRYKYFFIQITFFN